MFLVHFWSIFLVFGGKKNFSWKSESVMHNFKWISSTMQKFRKKIIMQFQENTQKDGGTDGRMDRPYFIGPFWQVQKVVLCKWYL